MFFEYFYTLILALIQGITEFIPVSSSSHLIIFSKESNFSYESLELDVGLHLGSLIAILLYFRKDLIEIKKNKNLLHHHMINLIYGCSRNGVDNICMLVVIGSSNF